MNYQNFHHIYSCEEYNVLKSLCEQFCIEDLSVGKGLIILTSVS